ncbi:MAG: hypothetical protein R6W93_14275 [Candidatus Limnocylindrales bacterium]
MQSQVMRQLKSIGVTPDHLYLTSMAAIILSLLLWFVPRGGDSGRAERLAIFVGLWPPTLFLMGHALADETEHDQSRLGGL